jgi:hypothetical protein
MAIWRQLGWYQFFVILSRFAGFMRDFLVIWLIGVGALADRVFFLVGVVDFLMAFVAGSGAAVFLAALLRDDDGNKAERVYRSAILAFITVGAVVTALEVGLRAPLGRTLFHGLGAEPDLVGAYLLVIAGLMLSLPMVVSNAIYLHRRCLFLQPAVAMSYTAVLMAGFFLLYSSAVGFLGVAAIIVVALLVRFVIGNMLAIRLLPIRRLFGPIIFRFVFYRQLMVSGIGIGVVALLPFLFRAALPTFGDGYYSATAFLYKFNDLAHALLVIPLVSLYLTGVPLERQRGWILWSMVIAIGAAFQLGMWAVRHGSTSLGFEFFEDEIVKQVATMVALTFVISSCAYLAAMLSIARGASSINLLASAAAVGLMIVIQRGGGELSIEGYFAGLYASFAAYLAVLGAGQLWRAIRERQLKSFPRA